MHLLEKVTRAEKAESSGDPGSVFEFDMEERF